MSFSSYLNDDNDIQQTTLGLLSKEFHSLMILLQQKYFFYIQTKITFILFIPITSSITVHLYCLYLLPLVLLYTDYLILLPKLILTRLCNILYIQTKSALILRSSRDSITYIQMLQICHIT